MTTIRKHYRQYYWERQHQAERKRIQQTGRCLCGAKLDEHNRIIDRGAQYGFECEQCR